MWTSVISLAIASALVPVQIVVTVLLLRADTGHVTAVAWVAAFTVVRLAQGVVFGLLLADTGNAGARDGGQGPIASSILLVAGVLFVVSAVRALVRAEDPDAPPPARADALADTAAGSDWVQARS